MESRIACGDPRVIPGLRGAIVRASLCHPQTKPNVPGVLPPRRDGGPHTGSVSEVRGGLHGAVGTRCPDFSRGGRVRKPGRPGAERANGSRPARPARRRRALSGGSCASSPARGRAAFPCPLRRAPRPPASAGRCPAASGLVLKLRKETIARLLLKGK